MKKETVFSWQGTEHRIERVRLGALEEYFDIQERLNEGGMKEQIACVRKMLELLNCPPDVLDDLSPNELEPCIVALQSAQLASGDGTGDESGKTQAAG